MMMIEALRKVIKRMHYPLEVMLTCVRWYAAYPLSLRHIEEMMAERGVFVDHATVHRWAIKILPILAAVFRRHKRPVGTSWRIALRAHHRSTIPMQHSPRGLVTAQAKNPLQPKSADALLHAGDVPGSGKPHPQRRSGLLEDGPSRDTGLMAARPAYQAASRGSTRHWAISAAPSTLRKPRRWQTSLGTHSTSLGSPDLQRA
jgi:hypothetical protein